MWKLENNHDVPFEKMVVMLVYKSNMRSPKNGKKCQNGQKVNITLRFIPDMCKTEIGRFQLRNSNFSWRYLKITEVLLVTGDWKSLKQKILNTTFSNPLWYIFFFNYSSSFFFYEGPKKWASYTFDTMVPLRTWKKMIKFELKIIGN